MSARLLPVNRHHTQRIRDPVHGLILFGDSGNNHQNEADRLAWRLINTREFQRLRRIRQLGFSDLVFPGATHSRFAHSIGVYHTARRLVGVIARQSGNEHNEERARVALLAAILHDIGHGPFSHAFESASAKAGLFRRHEDWSAQIVRDDTEVNGVLRDLDEAMPDKISALLKEDEPKDIYATIVSSQFDADRLDYIQRDRMATGVEFGHVDQDWLFDCLRVGSITVGQDPPSEAACLYLGPKGVSVAEEYLEARFRLYQMVYMHKTTRAAEKMLEALLSTAETQFRDTELARQEPSMRYFTSETPSLGEYLGLDDSSVWTALTVLADQPDEDVCGLARRLRARVLYKCVDVGSLDQPNGNLYLRLRRKLEELFPEWHGNLLYDEPTMTPYAWYDFGDTTALNKILVKTHNDDNEPQDIANFSISPIITILKTKERIQRIYAPDPDITEQLQCILREVKK